MERDHEDGRGERSPDGHELHGQSQDQDQDQDAHMQHNNHASESDMSDNIEEMSDMEDSYDDMDEQEHDGYSDHGQNSPDDENDGYNENNNHQGELHESPLRFLLQNAGAAGQEGADRRINLQQLLLHVGQSRIIAATGRRDNPHSLKNLALKFINNPATLHSSPDPTLQTQVSDFCSALSMATEDDLIGFPYPSCIEKLIQLLDRDESPELMLIAARSITYLVDVFPPAASKLIRSNGIQKMNEKLSSLHYIELAEQVISAFDKVSRDYHEEMLKAGCLPALLQFIDFFSLRQQRVILQICSYLAKRVPAREWIASIFPSIPQLLGFFNYSDKKIVETTLSVFMSLFTQLDRQLTQNAHLSASDSTALSFCAKLSDLVLSNTLVERITSPETLALDPTYSLTTQYLRLLLLVIKTQPINKVSLLENPLTLRFIAELTEKINESGPSLAKNGFLLSSLDDLLSLLAATLPSVPARQFFLRQNLKTLQENSTASLPKVMQVPNTLSLDIGCFQRKAELSFLKNQTVQSSDLGPLQPNKNSNEQAPFGTCQPEVYRGYLKDPLFIKLSQSDDFLSLFFLGGKESNGSPFLDFMVSLLEKRSFLKHQNAFNEILLSLLYFSPASRLSTALSSRNFMPDLCSYLDTMLCTSDLYLLHQSMAIMSIALTRLFAIAKPSFSKDGLLFQLNTVKEKLLLDLSSQNGANTLKNSSLPNASFTFNQPILKPIDLSFISPLSSTNDKQPSNNNHNNPFLRITDAFSAQLRACTLKETKAIESSRSTSETESVQKEQPSLPPQSTSSKRKKQNANYPDEFVSLAIQLGLLYISYIESLHSPTQLKAANTTDQGLPVSVLNDCYASTEIGAAGNLSPDAFTVLAQSLKEASGVSQEAFKDPKTINNVCQTIRGVFMLFKDPHKRITPFQFANSNLLSELVNFVYHQSENTLFQRASLFYQTLGSIHAEDPDLYNASLCGFIGVLHDALQRNLKISQEKVGVASSAGKDNFLSKLLKENIKTNLMINGAHNNSDSGVSSFPTIQSDSSAGVQEIRQFENDIKYLRKNFLFKINLLPDLSVEYISALKENISNKIFALLGMSTLRDLSNKLFDIYRECHSPLSQTEGNPPSQPASNSALESNTGNNAVIQNEAVENIASMATQNGDEDSPALIEDTSASDFIPAQAIQAKTTLSDFAHLPTPDSHEMLFYLAGHELSLDLPIVQLLYNLPPPLFEKMAAESEATGNTGNRDRDGLSAEEDFIARLRSLFYRSMTDNLRIEAKVSRKAPSTESMLRLKNERPPSLVAINYDSLAEENSRLIVKSLANVEKQVVCLHHALSVPQTQSLLLLSFLNILFTYSSNLTPEDSSSALDRFGLASRIQYGEYQKKLSNLEICRQLESMFSRQNLVLFNELPSWAYLVIRQFAFLITPDLKTQILSTVAFGPIRYMTRRIFKFQSEAPMSQPIPSRVLNNAPRSRKTRFKIDRNHLFAQGLRLVSSRFAIKDIIEIEYKEEIGIGLGPTLEFYSLMTQEFINSRTMWSQKDGLSHLNLYPCIHADGDLNNHDKAFESVVALYKNLGRFVGRALLDNRALDLPLAPVFFNYMKGDPFPANYLDMLGLSDPTLANSFRAMLVYDNRYQALVLAKKNISDSHILDYEIDQLRIFGARLADLTLTMVVPGHDEIELVEGGADISVCNENLSMYVRLCLEHLCCKGIYRQMHAFCAGLNEVVKPQSGIDLSRAPSSSSAHILSQQDLFGMLSLADFTNIFYGYSEEWTFDLLVSCIKPDHGYTMENKAITHLLEWMLELGPDEKKKFIQFITGNTVLPYGGLRSLNPPLTVVRKLTSSPTDDTAEEVDRLLPSVMTCSNYLKLPDYSSKELMCNQLKRAIDEGGYSFHLS